MVLHRNYVRLRRLNRSRISFTSVINKQPNHEKYHENVRKMFEKITTSSKTITFKHFYAFEFPRFCRIQLNISEK